jgi:hypothetical protein
MVTMERFGEALDGWGLAAASTTGESVLRNVAMKKINNIPLFLHSSSEGPFVGLLGS